MVLLHRRLFVGVSRPAFLNRPACIGRFCINSQLLPDAAAFSSMQGTPASSIFPMGDKDAFGRGRRYPISDKAAVCPGRCSSKSPSTEAKVNYLVIRYLYFRSVRGDLQEDHVYDKRLCGYASRCQFSLFPVPIPVSPSTKRFFVKFRAVKLSKFGRF